MTRKTMTNEERISIVESVLEHSFTDKALVLQAITHPSAVEADPDRSYQRLEFLGDSIVGFTVGLEAYRRFPHMAEGELTRMRIAVVNGAFLTSTAATLGLADAILFGSSEFASGSRGMNSALEDVFESLTAALYLDAGMEKAQAWVLRCLGSFINPATAQVSVSPKSELQELVQAQGKSVLYEIIDSSGPSHQPTFTAQVLIDGQPLGVASGTSKKEAEAFAAQAALDQLSSS